MGTGPMGSWPVGLGPKAFGPRWKIENPKSTFALEKNPRTFRITRIDPSRQGAMNLVKKKHSHSFFFVSGTLRAVKNLQKTMGKNVPKTFKKRSNNGKVSFFENLTRRRPLWPPSNHT